MEGARIWYVKRRAWTIIREDGILTLFKSIPTNQYLSHDHRCVETTKQEIGRDLRVIAGAGLRHCTAMNAVTTLLSVFSDQFDMEDNIRSFTTRNWLASGFQRPVDKRIGISSTRDLGLLWVLTSVLSNFRTINEELQPRNE